MQCNPNHQIADIDYRRHDENIYVIRLDEWSTILAEMITN